MRKRLVVIVSSVVAAAGIGGIAYATIPGSDGVVSACLGTNGLLRVIDGEAGETCRSSERPLDILAAGASSVLQSGSPAGGDLAGTYPNPTIAAGAVGTTAFGAIPTAKISRCCAMDDVPSGLGGTTLAFDVESFDVGNMYDPAQPTRLTAPVDGVYLITANVVWPVDTVGGVGFREIHLLRNGFFHLAIASERFPPDNDQTMQHISVPVKLVAGQWVELAARQTSGGPLTISTVYPSNLSMTWIAPG